MRNIFIIISLFISVSAFSQELNRLGKIEVQEIPQMPDHRIEKIGSEYKVYKDSFVFEGNSYYELPTGIITTLEVFDNKKDYIKHYDGNGKLIVTILTDRIINLKVSEGGSKLAFYNTKDILHINLKNYQIDTLSGSAVYEFIGNDLMYYDAEKKNICFKEKVIPVEQYPNQFLEFKNKVYVISKANIFELIGTTLTSKYEFKGEFFDSKIIHNEFYLVDKEEKRKEEIFSMYKTSDFLKFMLVDRKDDLNR